MQVVVLLVGALVLGAAARRLGLPAMVGELLAGVVLGPSVFGLVFPDAHDRLFGHGIAPTTSVVAHAGIALMVGLAASEIDGTFVRARAGAVVSVATASFGVPLALGIVIGVLAPAGARGAHAGTAEFALLLGTALSVSAIPVIARVLVDLDLLRSGVGQLTLAIAALTDVGAWILLAIVAAMATAGGSDHLAVSLAALAAMIAITWVLRRSVRIGFDRIEAFVGDRRGSAVVISSAAAVMITIGAIVSDALHLEVVLGAFLAGLVIGRRGGRALRPLQSITTWLLAPVFLATAGLHLDVRVLGTPWVLTLGVVMLGAAIVGKIGGTYVGARAARVSRRNALSLGAGLNARGVVEIVIAGVGLQLGVFTVEVATIIVVIALVTSLMAGPMLSWLHRDRPRHTASGPGDRTTELSGLTPGR